MDTTETFTLLLIEDNPGDVRLFRKMLAQGQKAAFNLEVVARLEEGIARLRQEGVDIVVSDLNLPDSSGIETFRRLKSEASDVPVVVLTGAYLEEESGLEAVREGAEDYLTKDVLNGTILYRTIRYAIARKQTEKLARSEREFRTLAENSPDVITRYDRQLRHRYVNQAGAKVVGLPAEQILGKTLAELGFPEEKIASWHKRFDEALASRRQVTFETDFDSPRLGMRRFLMTLVPESDERGNIVSYLGISRDITDFKKAEDILRRNEYELRTLVDNSPDLIFRLNRQSRYVYVNPSYERLTGITKEQFTGKTNSELGMPRPLVEFWQEALKRALESGRESSVEFDISGFFGRRYFLARLIPEFTRTGIVDTVLVIARDITECKQAEEQVRYISFHDKVTGLYNRAFFEEEIRRLDTERELPLSIIMGDVNNLKLTNDVFGHDEGDSLLKAIASFLRKACRKHDVIARWGGDEYAVILPKTDFSAAVEVCGRIKQAAGESKGSVIVPGIALGIATKKGRDQNIYYVIRQAEERMYENKLAEGKQNEYNVFDSLFECARTSNQGLDAHLERSRALADAFGRELELPESQQDDLRLLVKFHDIGEAVIPREILMKPGPLTPQEWEAVKKHPEAGLRIVKTFVDTARAADEVFSHGERWDGTGYPRGLKGKEIPYLCRIFAVIDAYDVMTHERPYARVRTREEAVEELRRSAGRQFDPDLVDLFISLLRREKAPV